MERAGRRSRNHGKKEIRTDILYGRRPVLEALKAAKTRVQKVLMNAESHGTSLQEILALVKEKRVQHQWVPARTLYQYTDEPHQGVIAFVSPTEYKELDEWLDGLDLNKNPWVLLLDGIEDPQNLGALIRNAVCFGAAGVVIPEWRAAPVTPAVVKSSAGATEHVPIIRVKNLSHPVHEMKERGFQLFGGHMEGEDCRTVDFSGPLGLIVGGEGQGLRPIMQKSCDKLVRIPQTSPIGSLNASSAAAILFYEVFRRKNP